MLYRAARDGEAGLASLLLSYGADPSLSDAIDVRPEAIAFLNSHSELALALREARMTQRNIASNSSSHAEDGPQDLFQRYQSLLWPSLTPSRSLHGESIDAQCSFGEETCSPLGGMEDLGNMTRLPKNMIVGDSLSSMLSSSHQPIYTVLSVAIVLCSVLLNLLLLRVIVRGWRKTLFPSDANKT